MTDFSKMTARALREAARKLLGPGHSRLRTKAELVRALEEAASSAAAAPARAARRVRAAANRAADATGKAVRAVTEVVEAVGRAARSSGKRAAGAGKPAGAGKTAARQRSEAGAGAARAGGTEKRAGKQPARPEKVPAGATKGARAAKGARPAAPARKARKAAAAAGAPGARAATLSRRAGPDPDGFFVARVRGEDAVREAPHPLVEPEPEGDEEELTAPPGADERLGELPWGYGDDAFVALPRDPRTLFLYWDWSADTTARAFEGLDHPRAQLWILARAGAGWDRVRTVEFALESRGYYVHDLQPGRTYRAEIHAVDRHGRERIVSHGSNEVVLPLVGPSPVVDDRFVRIPWDLSLGRLVGPGHAGAPFSEEARALLARLSDWSRFAGREAWGSGAGGMGGRPSSPTSAPSSPTGPTPPRER